MSARTESGTTLAPSLIEAIADRLATLAEPTRIRIIEALNREEANVQELADLLDLPHQNVSQHLNVLYRRGILSRRRVGVSAVYAIEDWGAWWLISRTAEAVSES